MAFFRLVCAVPLLQGVGDLRKESSVSVGERASIESSGILRLERGTSLSLAEAALASLKGKLHLHDGESDFGFVCFICF